MDPSAPEPPTVPGYAVGELLGQGASARVWRGRRSWDGLEVALKVVHPAGGEVAGAMAEAGLLARVRHPHVVHLHDVLPLPDPRTGRPAAVVLVTQLAAGGSLAQLLARRRMLSPGEVVTVLQPVAGALADLHRTGVVHGDLSCGNVLFLPDGMPVLADLGTARVAGEPTGGAPVGTGAAEGMVAPEVLEGFAATAESDVYQLGALAWTCLVGEPPGPGYLREPLAQVAPALPAALVDLVQRCLAPQPEDRPDAEEVAVGLLGTATPAPVEVAPDVDAAHGLTRRLRQVAQEDLARAGRVRDGGGAHRARGRRTLVLAAPVVLVVLAVLTVGVQRGVGRPPATPTAVVTSPAEAATSAAPGPTEAATSAAPGPTEAATSAAPGPTEAPHSPDDPVAAVRSLVQARGAAWAAGDPGLLREALAPGSPALAADTTQLGRAVSDGVGYGEVVFVVDRARLLDRQGDQAWVAATVSRADLEVTVADGAGVTRPASTQEVRLELVRDQGRWLLWGWDDPAAPR